VADLGREEAAEPSQGSRHYAPLSDVRNRRSFGSVKLVWSGGGRERVVIRRHRAVKVGFAVVVLAGALWGGVTLTRPSTRDVMPTGSPGGTAPLVVSTTTGMSAVGVVGVRVGEGSRTLVVNLAACGAVRNAVDVIEDASRVLLYARTTGGGDGFCSDGTNVVLSQDLGQRTVIDGQTGQSLTVEGR
jgi:hypothetical protein